MLQSWNRRELSVELNGSEDRRVYSADLYTSSFPVSNGAGSCGCTHFISLASGLLPVSQLGLAAQQTAFQGLEFVSLQLHQPAQLSGWTPRYRCYSITSNPAQVQADTALLGLFGWMNVGGR